jgi:hypothetical protein
LTFIDDQELAVCDMLKVASGGAAEREASDVAVKPVGEPTYLSAVTTEIPAP